MALAITLIIASKNGQNSLPLVFEALIALDKHADDIQFLLVDNGSDDDSAAIMDGFAKQQILQGHTALVIQETTPGKSAALNAALVHVTGDLLVFLDDDVLPETGWLTAFSKAAIDNRETGIFCGQIRPKFLAPAPEWLEELTQNGRACACTRIDQKPGPCSPSIAKGGNWAIRREALGRHRFDVARNNLLHGKKPTGGQDTELARRLARDGISAHYIPEAVAKHMIKPHEMTARALFERYRRIGRGGAAQGSRSIFGKLLLPFELVILAVTAPLAWVFGAKNWAALALTRIGSRIGQLEYLLKI